jgi:predicted porin
MEMKIGTAIMTLAAISASCVSSAFAQVANNTQATDSAQASQGLQFNVGPATLRAYGVADIFFADLSGKLIENAGKSTQSEVTQNFTGFGSSGWTATRLGIKGEAPISDSLKGLFTIELGTLSLDQSSSSITNGLNKTRQSFVGLKGNFGTIVAGRLQTPAFVWAYEYDPMNGAIDPVYAVVTAVGAGINAADRLNDAITWTSPDLSGLTLKGTYAFNGQNDISADDATAANHKQTTWLIAADYVNGPFTAGAVARTVSNTSGLCANANNSVEACAAAGSSAYLNGQKEWAIGAAYDLRVVKLFGAYQTVSPNSSAYTSKVGDVGVSIPVGPAGLISAAYVSGNGTTVNASNTAVTTNVQAMTIAYSQDLNKYVTAYCGYLWGKNGSNLFGSGLNLSNYTSSASYSGALSSAPNSTLNGLVVGLRYTF